ncbi:MAG: spiro-SPASM protein [Turneriella sp.]
MTQTALLIHTPAAYAPDFTMPGAASLPEAFAATVLGMGLPVYLCVADDGLRQRLASLLAGSKLLAADSEISAVRALFADNGISHILVCGGVFPLLDTVLTQKLYDIHTEYRADITYGENLPPGIAPHIVSRDLLESLEIMEASDTDVAAAGLRPFVEKNINQFHAEVHYEEPDLRVLRLDFSLTSRRSVAKTAALMPYLQSGPTYAALKPAIEAHPEVLVTMPSYLEIEFVSTAEHVSYFSPLKVIEQPKHLLSPAHFDKVLAYIAQGFGDTSVCASGLGEPLEHPHSVSYLTTLLENERVRYVFVETNGIHLDRLWPLATHGQADKLRVIVLLNSLERYVDYSGAPLITLDRVKANIQSFTGALSAAGRNAQELVYVQAFKVVENETEIDALYALAEDLGASFLLQKYNRYAGLLPERRVSDMTPLERYACWHLRRDLFIRANGDVAFCKQTIDQTKNSARGNLDKDTLADIWQNQRSDFVANYRGQYPAHLPCAACDEYFTFNF